MKKVKFLFSAFICLLSIVEANAQYCDTIKVSSEADDDAVVMDWGPNTNYQSHQAFSCNAWTTNGTPFHVRSYVRFDLPNLPSAALLQSAKILLFNNPTDPFVVGCNYYPGSPYPLQNNAAFYRVTQNWNSGTITWNDQPAYTTTNAAPVPASSSQMQNLMVDVTNLVKDMYTYPTQSDGFMFKLDVEAYYRSQIYASSNQPNAALHPRLVVCHAAPTGLAEVQNEGSFIFVQNGCVVLNNIAKLPIKNFIIHSIEGKLLFAQMQNDDQDKSVCSMALAAGCYIASFQLNGASHSKLVVVQ